MKRESEGGFKYEVFRARPTDSANTSSFVSVLITLWGFKSYYDGEKAGSHKVNQVKFRVS